jgi:hypothetical protein
MVEHVLQGEIWLFNEVQGLTSLVVHDDIILHSSLWINYEV